MDDLLVVVACIGVNDNKKGCFVKSWVLKVDVGSVAKVFDNGVGGRTFVAKQLWNMCAVTCVAIVKRIFRSWQFELREIRYSPSEVDDSLSLCPR
jgi:hypothetical protein